MLHAGAGAWRAHPLECSQAPAARPPLNPTLTLSRVERSPRAQGLSSTSRPPCQMPVVGPVSLGCSYFCPPQMWLVGSHDAHNSYCSGKCYTYKQYFIVKDTNEQPDGEIPRQPILKLGDSTGGRPRRTQPLSTSAHLPTRKPPAPLFHDAGGHYQIMNHWSSSPALLGGQGAVKIPPL